MSKHDYEFIPQPTPRIKYPWDPLNLGTPDYIPSFRKPGELFGMSKEDYENDPKSSLNENLICTSNSNNLAILVNNFNSNTLFNEDQKNDNQNDDKEINNLDLTPRSPKSGRSLLPGGITEKERNELSPNSFYDYLFQRNRFSLK